MRIAAAFAVVAMLASGSASAQSIVKIFHFDQNGVLPSDDSQIDFFFAFATATEEEVYSVSGGMLQQRSFNEDGNYSYTFPNFLLTGGGLDPSKDLVMEARLRILEFEGVDGVFYLAFDGANRYGMLFDERGLVFFDAQRKGPSVNLSDLDFSVFHTYRIESDGGTSAFRFLVDGSVVFSGNAASAGPTVNGFEWGDGLSDEGNGADVDWDYVAFGQPAVVPTIVGVDIKPRSDKNNINVCAQGGIKVAILSAANFDATSVDPLSVDLAGALVIVKPNGEPQTQQSDVNSDGITDLVLHIQAADIGLAENAGEAILNGQTFASEPVQGADAVTIKRQMCLRSVEEE